MTALALPTVVTMALLSAYVGFGALFDNPLWIVELLP